MRNVLILFSILFAGCVSQVVPVHDYATAKIGAHVDEIKNMEKYGASYQDWGWRNKMQTSSDGKLEYVTMASKSCWVYWELDDKGVIVNYRTEGNCR